ncbi:hypothetical protein [Vibrio algivorus]|uniref:hypothetical protein n=1 Tax=Vibrio algivorus TaxID=1667024 RepID=UPI0011858444|nr:hypothetical protein [Vibrio algivorus]
MINNPESQPNEEFIPCYNIYIYNNNGSMILNKEYLSSEQIDFIHKEVNVLAQEFIYSHTDLINYIRFNYKDIVWNK